MSWKSIELDRVCDFVRGPFGGSLKKSFFKDSGYAVYEQKHAISGQFSEVRYYIDENKFRDMMRFELVPGDIIMSCSGTMGKVAIVPNNAKRGIINQALLKLSPKCSKIDAKFLKLWMESPVFQKQVAAHSKGVAIKNIASVKTLKEITISLPPIKEQQQIVNTLDQAFSLLDTLKSNTANQLTSAKELFESYLATIFNNANNNWKKNRLGALFEIGSSKRVLKSQWKKQGVPFYRGREVTKLSKYGYVNNELFISEELYSKYAKKHGAPKNDDIIITAIGTIGNSYVVKNKDRFYFKDASVLWLKKKATVSSQFINIWLQSSLMKKQLETVNGATVNTLTIKKMQSLTLNLPPLQEQQQIVVILDNLSLKTQQLTEHYQQKLNHIEELKQSILQQAFLGQLSAQSSQEAICNVMNQIHELS